MDGRFCMKDFETCLLVAMVMSTVYAVGMAIAVGIIKLIDRKLRERQ